MRGLRKCIEILGCVAVLLTVLLVAIGVYYRFVLQDSLRWTNEMATDVFVWAVFLGAGLSALDNEQLRFEMIVRRIGKTRVARIIIKLIEMVALGVTLYFAVKITYLFRNNRMESIDIPAIWALIAPPTGIFFVLLATAYDALLVIRERTRTKAE